MFDKVVNTRLIGSEMSEDTHLFFKKTWSGFVIK